MAVDALNLRADQRGMGRYVRAVLRDLAADTAVELTLLVRDARNAAAYGTLVPRAEIRPTGAARRTDAFAAVWYPWNGMRFACRAPAVVTINDDFAFRYPAAGRIARWREQRPIQSATRSAREIITISNWSRAQITERFALAPDRVTVIPLGPDPVFGSGDDTSPYAQPFILAVGAREERKNIGFLIEAFARAFPARDVSLVVVGSVGVSQRRRAGAAGIAFIERTDIDDIELRRLYRTATAVAVPSRAEGFGLVAVEAQACGAPVIAADTSALPEAVGLAGILLDPADSDAWTAALQQLVRDRALNAYYRMQSSRRWAATSRPRTSDAVRAVLQRAIDHGA